MVGICAREGMKDGIGDEVRELTHPNGYSLPSVEADELSGLSMLQLKHSQTIHFYVEVG